jgi:protoporphyrinogen oxidase
MSSALPHVIILGAGPAGLGAAYRLAREGKARVTVLEQQSRVGGGAASFDLAGMRVDMGSHRLHRGCEPAVLADIQSLLGDDLLIRQRHGSIRLRGRSIHFPLRPFDLATQLPPTFSLGILGDSIRKITMRRRVPPARENFATVLEAGLGGTICRDFYFPYAHKIWGLEPREISAEQARRRVSAASLGAALHKVLAAIPGIASRGDDTYFYPRHGYGQISESYRDAAVALGVRVELGCEVDMVEIEPKKSPVVRFKRDGAHEAVTGDEVWSTIPITRLAQSLFPSAPPEVIDAINGMNYRAMILIYLVLEQDRYGEYDAYYFPESDIAISRCSEPKNYRDVPTPFGKTILCAELPCSVDDDVWGADDASLAELVCSSLSLAGQPVTAPILEVQSRRLRNAYPMYQIGYEAHLETVARYCESIDRLLTFGRQGLFAHDNADQALEMAYEAVACFDNGGFDAARWSRSLDRFAVQVVQD